ncbi:hypothetical protein B0T26DRAFT_798456 [Lasiosphaeria miniovina]|uniref:Uncharacterized protein n=1 Tax=Lasiosphaeria miniovina TaxID=1954250 RepID=A0AA40EAR3_9PEZI|nr:uncharacterized protein B0T26DRAFT_798456 [Lasiosphaeria miniovina]KAK0734674.1 hypothetical protein B0T26DRAFT_798456 [Lasiosphaeria miniovina]
MSRRPVIVLSKPIKLRDHKERQRKADEDDELLADDNIDKERFRVWQTMRLFVEKYKGENFYRIWLGLCKDQKREKTIIRSYFRDYVESSQKTRPAFENGDDESQSIQTITRTKTVISHWRNLVVEADNTILREKRRDDPSIRGLWKLRWDKGDSRDSSVADISNFCVALYLTLVPAGLGFRPGSLMKFRYKHIRLLVVPDPENPSQNTIVAEITITYDKLQMADARA